MNEEEDLKLVNPSETTNTLNEDGKSDIKKKKKSKKKKISCIDNLYTNNVFPEGEWQDYPLSINSFRSSSKELKDLDSENHTKWNDFRKGAEIHRRVRNKIRSCIKEGMKLIEVADIIENSIRKYSGTNEYIKCGIGFPTGLSLNNIAAHYTPNPGDTTIIQNNDVLKIDIGVHVNGRICDSAFTMAFNKEGRYDNLLNAVREATNTGVKESGIDVRMNDIGECIQEVMESYEIELDGKLYPVKCIRNLNGHNIGDYQIHLGKTVPIVPNGDMTKMEEGEVYAIETFGSTGNGYVINDGIVSHFSRNQTANTRMLSDKAKILLKLIDKNFYTLPWCHRYISLFADFNYSTSLSLLVHNEIVTEYPPLVDIKNSFSAQFEHTILLHPHKKEVVTKGEDY